MSRHQIKIPDFVFENLDNMKLSAKSIGYSMKGLGEVIGIKGDVLSNLANGNIPPTRNYYNKIAGVLKWEVWE